MLNNILQTISVTLINLFNSDEIKGEKPSENYFIQENKL